MELCLRRARCPYLHFITSVESHCHAPHTSHMLDGGVGTCFNLPRFGWGQQHKFVLRMDEFAHLFPNCRQEIHYFCASWPSSSGKERYLPAMQTGEGADGKEMDYTGTSLQDLKQGEGSDCG